MEIFDTLGRRVAASWAKVRFDNRAFPAIAAAELDRAPLHRDVDYNTILKWLTSTDTLPFQPNIDTLFGEPPVTLFWHPAFYVEALFWHSSTTAIHGHGFAGAFQVLAGTSVQSLYEFDAQDTPGRCRIGRLRQTDVALLRPGSTQTIQSGEGFIHSVFHLGYPSVTIVIRNGGGDAPQYRYYRPGIAILSDIIFDQLTTRLLQVASLQTTLMSGDLNATVARIGQQCELAASFKLLQTLQRTLSKQKRLDVIGDVILTLAASHGPTTVTRLADAVSLEASLRPLNAMRLMTADEGLRLFLALLLTQQERGFIMAQTAAYTRTNEPGDTIVGWIAELGAKRALNVPCDDATKRLLKVWLERGRDAAFQHESMHENADAVASRIRRVQAEPLLAPLLRDDAESMTIAV